MDDLAARAAAVIYNGFINYDAEFKLLTRPAKSRFERRDWPAIKPAATERLGLYNLVLQEVIRNLQRQLGDRIYDKAIWAAMKTHYAALAEQFYDAGLAETYFNSATRRIFSTVGVDPQIEFTRSHLETISFPVDYVDQPPPVCRRYPAESAIDRLVQRMLDDYQFGVPWINRELDAARCAQFISAVAPDYTALDMVHPVFYRGKGAYLVGRIVRPPDAPQRVIPLLLALENRDRGLRVDAAIDDYDEISTVFSFTRSHFCVDTERPHDLIRFLKSLLPHKRIAELYITLGYNKHGKTELYWDFLRHLERNPDARFVRAPGERGMVMEVFIMPSYDMVFKVIKDRFDPPKTTTREHVKACYDIVFQHDRAGRLADAQEFEHFVFARDRFEPRLLDELLTTAAKTVSVRGDRVNIAHLYMERQMTPLNLYLSRVDEETADRAAVDYGQAVRDLAVSNIFPGDLFLKNFGVTRNGRVVFYDYDELAFVADLNFRYIPRPRHWEDDLINDVWYTAGPADVFPQQFESFLGLRPRQKQAFLVRHAELLTPVYWRTVQERLRAGDVIDIYPYDRERSFPYDY